MINIAIKATYYIFCCRNRNWDSPDLMQFWFLFFLAFVLFCFLFFLFNKPISSSSCKLPIRSEIYNCTFKKNKKSFHYYYCYCYILLSFYEQWRWTKYIFPILLAVSVVLAQEAPVATTQSSSGGRTRNCTVCKRPMRGHNLLVDCPRNQARQNSGQR